MSKIRKKSSRTKPCRFFSKVRNKMKEALHVMSNLIGVRVAGVVIHENAILLHTSDKDDFWVFPGGGCKPHETTIKALEREIYEEIKTKIEVKNLIWVIENFYEYGKEKYHGIEFFYRMEFRENNHFYDRQNFMGYEKENDTSLLFQWHDINEVDDIVIYPKSLKNLIKDIPNISGVQHIINNDLR